MNLFKSMILLLGGVMILGTTSLKNASIATTPISTPAIGEGMWATFSQADALVIGKDHVLAPIAKDKDAAPKLDKTNHIDLTSGGETYHISAADKLEGI